MIKFIQKCFDLIGMRLGNPVRSFFHQIYLFYVFLRSNLRFYRRKLKMYYVQYRYKRILRVLQAKASKNEKIAVGFYVLFDSIFSFRPLFEKMLQDDFFDPYIVIASEVFRGKKSEIERAKQTYESLTQKYGTERVILGYDYQNDTYTDLSGQFDIIAFATPYEGVTHRYYMIKYLYRKNVLTIYTNYGYCISSNLFIQQVAPSFFIAYLWNIYGICRYEMEIYKKYSLYHGKNAILTGFLKMDAFTKPKTNLSGRKLIIIAPHHTVGDKWKNTLELSNFPKYYNLILQLPERYPQIDFVFRPHPLLFETLIEQNIWTQQQVDEYLQKLTSFPNVRYSTEGDYSQLFANSDALIHDCGSYMAEYYFMDKPQCFVVKSDEVIMKHLNEFGQECISHAYKAYSEQDIVNFIESVVISENDVKYEERRNFWEQELKCNYPNIVNSILESIKNTILNGSNL